MLQSQVVGLTHCTKFGMNGEVILTLEEAIVSSSEVMFRYMTRDTPNAENR